jgi:hypothetical protein
MPRSPQKTTAPQGAENKKSVAAKSIGSTQSLSSFVKGICDILRRSNCASALQYVPELTWILFLRILDAQENKAREEAAASGDDHSPALRSPYRWQDWAAPCDVTKEDRTPEGQLVGWKRQELSRRSGAMFEFINKELLPYLHGLDVLPGGLPNPAASPKQRVIGRIMTAVERVRVDSETDFAGHPGPVHEIDIDHIDDTALLHPVAGLRGPAAEDGREELRRRPVLHPARGGARHGGHAGPALWRDGLRPLLRHRRLPGPGLRVDEPQAWATARSAPTWSA